MKIIEPNVELWEQEDAISHVARCARVCYRRKHGNDIALYNHLNEIHHWSMFRHETIYAKALVDKDLWAAVMSHYMKCPYIDWIMYDGHYYIVTNGNFLRDIEKVEPVLYGWLIKFAVDKSEFENIDIIRRNLMRYTFCIDTQISTSRELNRVSPNNISEQSTRYVYEDGTICRPHWMNKDIAEEVNKNLYPRNFEASDIENQKTSEYVRTCANGFRSYRKLVDEYGMHRQDARGILPLDTATRCVYTYTIKEWCAIIDLRYYGITGQPHPNAKIIADMIRDELIKLGYDFK